jgi:hypothetical protein
VGKSRYSGKSAMLVPGRPSHKGVRSFEIGSYLFSRPELLVTPVLSAQTSRI